MKLVMVLLCADHQADFKHNDVDLLKIGLCNGAKDVKDYCRPLKPGDGCEVSESGFHWWVTTEDPEVLQCYMATCGAQKARIG